MFDPIKAALMSIPARQCRWSPDPSGYRAPRWDRPAQALVLVSRGVWWSELASVPALVCRRLCCAGSPGSGGPAAGRWRRSRTRSCAAGCDGHWAAETTGRGRGGGRSRGRAEERSRPGWRSEVKEVLGNGGRDPGWVDPGCRWPLDLQRECSRSHPSHSSGTPTESSRCPNTRRYPARSDLNTPEPRRDGATTESQREAFTALGCVNHR